MDYNATPLTGQDKFRMSEHVDKLTPVKGKKNKYYCPVCNGNDLSVNLTTNAYTCYNGCDRKDIREAVAPWQDKQQEAKPVRPKADRTWTYTDIDGKEIVRTRRIDYGDGVTKRRIWQEYSVPGRWVAVKGSGSKPTKKFEVDRKATLHWVAGSYLQEEIKAPLKKALVPYRYEDIKKAVENNETVYWVEGEVCCDAMWRLGLPATTTIGGTDGLINDDGSIPYGNYSKLFEGASLVICPDRDQGGIKYAEKLAAMYPAAKWLYAFPESPVWKALPKDKGLDVADWIESGATAEQIVGAIEEKRDLGSKAKLQTTTEALSIEQVQIEVSELCEQALSKSDLTAKILSLAERSGRQANHVWSLYYACEEDASKAEEPSGINELLALQKTTLKARDIFHPDLAMLIEESAIAMPTAESWFVTTLLPALGAAMTGRQRLIIKRSAGYLVSPIVWSVIVARSGRLKSPTQKAIVQALDKLDDDAYQRYKAALKAHKKAAKDNPDEETEAPTRERFYAIDLTPEGLTRVVSESPSFLIRKDEIGGFFKSFNKYTNGSDEEDFWLSVYDGGSLVKDRADTEKSTRTDSSCVNITGSIQWQTLEDLQKKRGFSDNNGMLARFLFCGEDAPPNRINLDDDDDEPQRLPDFLKELYGALRGLSSHDYLLSREARPLFQEWQHRLNDFEEAETHPGLTLVYPKIQTYTARFALILHVTNAMFENGSPAPVVSRETMQKAILLAQYYLNQAKLVYAVNDPESEQDKFLMKIIELGCKKGVLTARDVVGQRPFRDTKVKTPEIREMFIKLVEMGHGTIEIPKGKEDMMRWVYAEQKTDASKNQNITPVNKESTSTKTAAPPPKNEAVDIAPTVKTKAKWEPKEGESVKYVGTNELYKVQYSGILKVRSVTSDGVSCLKNDGGLSTWLPVRDLKPVDSEVTA